jgi:hypothetical protein
MRSLNECLRATSKFEYCGLRLRGLIPLERALLRRERDSQGLHALRLLSVRFAVAIALPLELLVVPVMRVGG